MTPAIAKAVDSYVWVQCALQSSKQWVEVSPQIHVRPYFALDQREVWLVMVTIGETITVALYRTYGTHTVEI